MFGSGVLSACGSSGTNNAPRPDASTVGDAPIRVDAPADARDSDAKTPRDDGSTDAPSGDTAIPFEPGYLRVTAYGATGDGVHDDRPAIQAAMDAARAINGTVYFDPGTYLLAFSTQPNDHLIWTGFGAPF